ncbi:trypsin-like peptidase domain-containing protein [Actinomadura sp. PM05-2]|uniref:Trypsin-like peptidase domain-containing protein n=2 Tax=Actinomadura parmotrematis TaxID=2864039 RepID=A0ABS7FLU9_9ACTN|nr:trypsin-like peptidase domain-containing protein [Actinomadura parmotrematis]
MVDQDIEVLRRPEPSDDAVDDAPGGAGGVDLGKAPAGSAEEGDRLVAGFAPPDGPAGRPAAATPEQPQYGQQEYGQQEYAPQNQGPQSHAPQNQGPQQYAPQPYPQDDRAAAYAAAQGVPPAEDGRPRPGFVPHDQPHDPRGGNPYGWPQQRSPQPPPPGAPGPGGPGAPPPGGPRPMQGYGQPPSGPNWAPVPAPPPSSRSGPGFGLLAVMALLVALVAGGVGAGIGVMAADDDGGPGGLVSGSDSGGGTVQSRPPDSVAGVAQKVLPSVVMIRVRSGQGEGAGTGFIVNGGYIVTNNHVASMGANGGQIEIVFNDKKTLPATIRGTDPSSDIAVLKPTGSHSMPALTAGDSAKIAVGDPVIAIGSPLGLQGSVTTGIVSALNRAVPTQGENGADGAYLNAIQTDAAINPGNSGGPLVNGKGQVIGINTAIATLNSGQGFGGQESESGSIGLGFAIPINQAQRVANEIIKSGTVRQARLGVLPDPNSQGGAKILSQAVQGQDPVTKGGPADKAGLKPGDLITKVNDQPIEDASDLIAQIRSKAPGDKMKITYQRNGREATVEVTLGSA